MLFTSWYLVATKVSSSFLNNAAALEIQIKTLQFVVDEMRYRKEFYAKHPEERSRVTSPEAKGEPVESYIYSPDESLSLSLEYYSPEATEEAESDKETALKHLPRRYLRCPAAVTIFHLQKLIRAKYGLSEAHRVDIMYKEEPLCANYTLMDVMYIYHWRRVSYFQFLYDNYFSKKFKIFTFNSETLNLGENCHHTQK